MSDDFKLDWHKIERAAGRVLFETGHGKMRFDDARREWIEKLAASLSRWWKIGTEDIAPQWSDIRDQEKEIEALAGKLVSLLQKSPRHALRKTLIEELTRLHADTSIASTYSAEKAKKSRKGELWRDQRNMLVHHFICEWSNAGGIFQGPTEKDACFRSLVEIFRQCSPEPKEQTDAASKKAIRSAITANKKINYEAEISPLFIQHDEGSKFLLAVSLKDEN